MKKTQLIILKYPFNYESHICRMIFFNQEKKLYFVKAAKEQIYTWSVSKSSSLINEPNELIKTTNAHARNVMVLADGSVPLLHWSPLQQWAEHKLRDGPRQRCSRLIISLHHCSVLVQPLAYNVPPQLGIVC